MRFNPWKCPECGQPAKGMLEMVPGLTRLLFDLEGNAEYDGGVDLCWDGQTAMCDDQGRVTLECPEGHQWQADPPEDILVSSSGIGSSDQSQVSRLIQLATQSGPEDNVLDDLVHDTASAHATSVNNAGIAGQIEYLVAKLGRDETERMLTALLV